MTYEELKKKHEVFKQAGFYDHKQDDEVVRPEDLVVVLESRKVRDQIEQVGSILRAAEKEILYQADRSVKKTGTLARTGTLTRDLRPFNLKHVWGWAAEALTHRGYKVSLSESSIQEFFQEGFENPNFVMTITWGDQ